MKRQPTNRMLYRITLRSIILLILAILAYPTLAQAAQLVAPGQPMATIYTTGSLENPKLTPQQLRLLTAEQREARQQIDVMGGVVNDLAYHLEKMSGQRPSIVITDDVAQVKAPAIVLGTLASKLGATPKYETVMQESFRLLTRDNFVLIGGESVYGVSHGAYEFLRLLGCDWIFPGPEGEIIPQRETITIRPFDLAKKPALEMRAPWYSGGRPTITVEEEAQFNQWKNRQQQTYLGRSHPKFMGGGHFWFGQIRSNKALLEANPEMRALTRQPDGTLARTWDQLEPTHPGVVDLAVKYIRDLYKTNGWANDHTITMSIGPNDGGGYSISPEAMAASAGHVDPLTGDNDQTDVMVLYANKVLEELTDEYPNLYLGFLLYGVHGDYPMRYKPHPHLAIVIADITQSRYHSLLDRNSATRTYYRGVLEKWGKLSKEQGNPIGFYGYNWNLAENLMPYSKMKIWGQDLPYYYHNLGIIGHNDEQDKAWSILGPHNYLMARMGWDIDLDWQQVLTHYCELAFGKGGPAMEQYYLLLINTQESAGQEAGSHHAIPMIFDQDFINRSRELFKQADAAAQTPYYKKMVDYFGQSVTALEIYLQYRQAIQAFDFVKGKGRFDAMLTHWDTYNEKNSNLVSRYGRRYTRLFKAFVEQGLQYSTGDYKIVYPFPDELPTILDPEAQGQFMGLYHPELNDKWRMTTKTYSTTWDAQGLGFCRQGSVWYRVHFKLPEELPGKGIGLFIGAVDDSVRVWCNGAYIGSGDGFSKPFTFDLTAQARYGKENIVALQVTRNSMFNEMLTGGLFYPSFVFTGPQLETIAPRTDRPRRILPGGGGEDIQD